MQRGHLLRECIREFRGIAGKRMQIESDDEGGHDRHLASSLGGASPSEYQMALEVRNAMMPTFRQVGLQAGYGWWPHVSQAMREVPRHVHEP